jgi:transcriptional regulator of arginine metabolism
MSKTKRLLEISKLIKNHKICNQEELLSMLTEKGFSYTQATLSRDLKVLKAGKIADEEKGHIYVLPGDEKRPVADDQLKSAINRGFLSIEYSANMAVIKTLPGFASGIALRIDSLRAFEIMGTIAGDDTILVISREGVSRNELHRVLTKEIPSISDN